MNRFYSNYQIFRIKQSILSLNFPQKQFCVTDFIASEWFIFIYLKDNDDIKWCREKLKQKLSRFSNNILKIWLS